MESYFNPEYKLGFLSGYPKRTQTTYSYIFQKSKDLEVQKQKDLCEFDLSEFIDFFKILDMNYNSSAQSSGRIVTAYVDWAIKKKIKSNSDNILNRVDTRWFRNFVNKDAKIFYTKQEIINIIDKCKNPQDAVIISLIFDGVQGKAVSELRNLKETDVDDLTGQVALIDEDGSTRKTYVTQLSLDLIMAAYEEPYYYKSNGLMDESSNVRNYTELVGGLYIIRSSNTGKIKNLGPADKFVIYRRISTIEKALGLDNFTIKNISRSGMLSFANDKMKQKRVPINLSLLLDICNIYNVKSYNSIKEFVTEDNVYDLYGV
ncbi:hypothetical protein [Paenibacillus sp. FSL H8-0332]|uniref:phage lytic cycle repressor MrpR family protein n=1 Tax=Paenibacillus sp. FSL H8-0332 TaxID=2954742 RepID=UPI0030D60212